MRKRDRAGEKRAEGRDEIERCVAAKVGGQLLWVPVLGEEWSGPSHRQNEGMKKHSNGGGRREGRRLPYKA